MDPKILKIAGYAVSGIGIVATIVGNIINEKQTDIKLQEMVDKAFSEIKKSS